MTLRITGLGKRFGGLDALQDITFAVQPGQVIGLIGPNGAGKSTLFDLITGFQRPTAGTVTWNGQSLVGRRPSEIARLGIGRTFQLNPLFGDFTVLENVEASFYLRPHSGMLATFLNLPSYRRNERTVKEEAAAIVAFLGLDTVRTEIARNLPQGRQKLLGIARALATRPELLLLDEPLGGLGRAEVGLAMEALARLKARGLAMLLVEHNMVAMDLADEVHVIRAGRQIAAGRMTEIREDPAVIEAYFGMLPDAA